MSLLLRIVLIAYLLSVTGHRSTAFDSYEQAKKHPISEDHASVDFFEGALLGNGGLGVVVTTRPDGIVIHFGHNNVWDIRVAENNADKIGTFKEIFAKVKAIPGSYKSLTEDPWYREYLDSTGENYRKPYPRPFPCGSLLLGFDRREVALLGHKLDISNGLCEIFLKIGQQPAVLHIFTDMNSDRLWFRLVNDKGEPLPCCFDRVRLIPDAMTPGDFPAYTIPENLPPGCLSFRQTLPALEPKKYDKEKGSPGDKAFRLSLQMNANFEKREPVNADGVPVAMGPLERGIVPGGDFAGFVQLDEGFSRDIDKSQGNLPELEPSGYIAAWKSSEDVWKTYWNKSGVDLGDSFLEQVWYWNLYFFNCSAKEGATCPGLFANWCLNNIGTEWHSDYHMNYNTQQPFWVTFSSNHVEKNLPYIALVDHLMPISRKWAKEYYGLRGAYFPHSAYPMEMNIMPYPVPTWGWEICETPWTVQGLWWHYIYTMDKEFLEKRAFEPIRDAVLFLVDYMKRPEAHGEAWKDDKYHIFPTVPPELYGLKPGFRYNSDCLVDLTLTKFIFKAYLQAVETLGRDKPDAELINDVKDILAHYPEYPTAMSPKGRVFVSVPGERADMVYNVPNALMTVFPGEEHGLDSPKATAELLDNTLKNIRNEGGNELVFMPLQTARLGRLDLEEFKRQVRYCMLPNGTCADMVLQVHGRYSDSTQYDYMKRMGIWFENFALPVVINECLMQSYNGAIRLFPNWPKEQTAKFYTLRAAGAFLVSAEFADGRVQSVEITSEVGSPLRMINPWSQGAKANNSQGESLMQAEIIELKTKPGENIRFLPARQ